MDGWQRNVQPESTPELFQYDSAMYCWGGQNVFLKNRKESDKCKKLLGERSFVFARKTTGKVLRDGFAS